MSIGICVQYGLNMPIHEVVQRIKAHGFDNVLLLDAKEQIAEYGPTCGQIESARRAGLYVEELHLPYDQSANLWLDNQNGEAVMAEYTRILIDCVALEIPCAVLHTSHGGEPRAANERGAARLRALLDIAERGNFTIAIENLRSLYTLDFLFETIDSPRLGFCYDSGHEFCRDYPNTTIERYKERLACLHLHDNDGTADQHLLPGAGKIDWPATMKRLNDAHYSGGVMLEVIWEPSADNAPDGYEAFLSLAARKARELEAMME